MDEPFYSRPSTNTCIRRRRYRLASITSPLSPIHEASHASDSCPSPRLCKTLETRRFRRNFHKRQILTRKRREENLLEALLSPIFLTEEESYHLSALSMDVEMTGGETLGGLGFNSLTKSFIPSPGHLHPRHQKNDSLSSTSAASSTNSSPTTTVSTAESSSSADDKSPASSPDSPRNIIPLGVFSKPSLSSLNTSSAMTSSPNHPYRSLSPIKKARNTKNLSLNMSGSSSRPGTASSFQSNSSLNDNNRSSSAPSSPGFILPSTMPRRRPSNLGLTIKLPGPEKSIQKSTRPSLRHHVSSPSLFTPGGQAKTLSGRPSRLFTPPNHFSPVESVSSQSFSTQVPSSPIEAPGPIIEMDEEDIAMIENDGEGPKSPAYPNGPACIYEPNVFLFSEPNADMARKFDVVINVAREVVNPIKKEAEELAQDKLLSPPLATASTADSFMTAFESPQGSGSEATTPKPTPQKKDPEYIHMPWDHNTPIVGDLPKLVELIKQKSGEGKKVLIHCQCGVSRSASLIIAYGLFMNPRQTVQEAYDFVKQRSKWIGPNMSLIYQLSDWRAKLAAQNNVGRAGKGSMRGGANGIARPKMGHPSRAANSSDPTPYTPELDEPMTAPLPYIPGQVAPPRPPSPDPRDFPMPMNIQTRNADGGIITGIEPGPMSAPPGMINIPGTASVTNHGLGWGSGDAATGYVPPPLPPSSSFPRDQENDTVGDLVGFPARRGSDQGDLPPPTPSFAPKGGMIFEKRQLRNRNRKLLQSLRAEESSMPPPSPVTSSNPNNLLPSHSNGSPPQRSHSPQPSIKAILPKSSGLAALRAKKNKSELSRAMSEQSGVVRRAEISAARPNPEFHRRFPSILSSIDEPPPTPSFIQPPSSFGFPMRTPTITGKSHSDSHVMTRSRVAANASSTSSSLPSSFPGPTPSISNEVASPVDQPMSGTDNLDGVDLFSDPRSPVNQHDTLPTIRSIFDVL
ncbi:hypothetical protein H072_6607 [Dactylellina haptotyla CBS 200.50]|uniref:protein-tyrosine-phosphatase n=1 Tax=Dactylellina haptotyla (strain CBS 200.50) TaxID=1284197 RepID=S8A9I2_DACHA|nr:hypothetical protein H072_6607 [Dactylellina haptotyla CBS 200.50]